jgi:hypothetical protein
MVDKSRWKISTSLVVKDDELSSTTKFLVSENASKLIRS